MLEFLHRMHQGYSFDAFHFIQACYNIWLESISSYNNLQSSMLDFMYDTMQQAYSFDAFRFIQACWSISLESISSCKQAQHVCSLKFKFIRELGSTLGMKKKWDCCRLWFDPVAPWVIGKKPSFCAILAPQALPLIYLVW